MGLTAVTLGNGREDPRCGGHGSSCFQWLSCLPRYPVAGVAMGWAMSS